MQSWISAFHGVQRLGTPRVNNDPWSLGCTLSLPEHTPRQKHNLLQASPAAASGKTGDCPTNFCPVNEPGRLLSNIGCASKFAGPTSPATGRSEARDLTMQPNPSMT